MDLSEIKQQLKSLQDQYQTLKIKLNLEVKSEDLNNLQALTHQPGFWDDPQKAQIITQKASHLESFINTWSHIETSLADLPELLDMANTEEVQTIEVEVQTLQKLWESESTKLLLGGEHDQGSAIVSVHVGTGGQDAEEFTQMLERMYLRWAEQKDYKVTLLDQSHSDVGLKSSTFEVQGPLAYGFLKTEQGVHRLIRLSPFNAKSLRQTSFAKVEILPCIEQETDIKLEEKDLRIDVFRSSGAGGQSVNTTDSAVRVTYLPLNLVVTCQNEKSQHQNRESALKVLKSRLLQLKIEQNAEKLEELRGDKMEANFGSQIRTYTLQPYKLVKDHRTDFEHQNPEKVFDGDLDDFMQAFLKKI